MKINKHFKQWVGGGGGGGGGGGVTGVSVVTANGFAGSVANPTTTPAITIQSTLTLGSVVYATTNALTEDNVNFFYDDQNKVLRLNNPSAGTTFGIISIGESVADPNVIAQIFLNPATSYKDNQDGTIWYDASARSYIFTHYSSINPIREALNGTIYSNTSELQEDGSHGASSIFGGTGVGEKNIPADFFVIGKALRLTASGGLTTYGGAPTDTFSCNLEFPQGGGAIGSVAIEIDKLEKVYWKLEVLITCESVGSSGRIWHHMKMDVASDTFAIGVITPSVPPTAQHSSSAGSPDVIDTTIANLLDVFLFFSSGDANSTWYVNQIIIEAINQVNI